MTDIFLNLLINTDDVGNVELTEQEEFEVEEIMKHPDLKKYIAKDSDLD